MPKLIVLVFDGESTAGTVAGTLAQSAADGAKSVRFTEVDIRVVGGASASAATRWKALESTDRIGEYDGVVISAAAGEMPTSMTSMLDELEGRALAGAYANTVFGITGNDAALLGRVAQLGGIIVAEPRAGADDAGRAHALGARMAKVVEWVRHALSHEQKDHAHHHHH